MIFSLCFLACYCNKYTEQLFIPDKIRFIIDDFISTLLNQSLVDKYFYFVKFASRSNQLNKYS